MTFNFQAIKSVGHFLAKGFKALGSELLHIEQAFPGVVDKIEATQPLVDKAGAVAAVAGGGVKAVIATTVADLAYAGLGELGHLVSDLNAGGFQKLLDAGFDKQLLQEIEAAVKSTFGQIPKVLGK